tara:strand:+ start:766 stop:915 length:150 start_codon:yes stop_codon:yes gene_type:complete
MNETLKNITKLQLAGYLSNSARLEAENRIIQIFAKQLSKTNQNDYTQSV